MTEGVYRQALLEALRPPETLSVSAWANARRKLSPESSRSPGAWRNSRTPYLVELMDSLGPDCPARHVVLMKGAQIGGSEAGHNWLGWIVDQSPAPVMVVMPNVEPLARNWSKQRLAPMLRDTPALAEKVRPSRSRDSGNTVLTKQFPGGVIVITGANSAAGLRSMPVRYLVCDEVDAYPGDVEGEGDPLMLAQRGTRTYGADAKILYVSTPTFLNRSRIAREFRLSDRRYYHVPCPHCGKLQRLVWQGVHWENDDPQTTHYVCQHCGAVIGEHHKTAMLAAGRWIPEDPSISSERRGYHLSALYSPVGWRSWSDIVRQFLAGMGKLKGQEGEGTTHPDILRTWTNHDLGECWEEKGDSPPWEVLYNRRDSEWKGETVPARGALLTIGVDVQPDRLEAEVVAWGPGHESWSVAYVVIAGNIEDAAPWRELERLRVREWPHEAGGTMRARIMAVDAAFQAMIVKAWTTARPADQVIAIHGRSRLPVAVGQPTKTDLTIKGRRSKRSALLWPVGVDTLKSELYAWLRIPQPTHPEETGYPRGYAHFPANRGEEWFRQLCAEQLTRRMGRGGHVHFEWAKTRDRNEALDCRVYARAAAVVVGADRWSADDWESHRRSRGATVRARPTRRIRMKGRHET